MTLSEFKKHLQAKQNAIKYESDEDEGACDYHAEIQSIIDAIEAGIDVKKACEWVGEEYLVTDDDYDPTPYCAACGAMTRKQCHCGNIAENE